MSQHTKGPWAWQRFGDWCLTGQHGMRPIVLSVGRRLRTLQTRDAERDLLIPLEPDHPDARLIAAAPDYALLLRAMTAGLARWEPFADLNRGEVCVGGMRYSTQLDENGCPAVHSVLFHALEERLAEREKGGGQ